MNEKLFQRHIDELIQEIGSIPPLEKEKIKELSKAENKRNKKQAHDKSRLTESVDFLRLSIKYLLFDLEATRRENQYLRTLMEKDRDDE